MAGSLADIASGSGGNERAAYLAYVEACNESGKKAMSMADWIKAGKPAS